MKQNLFHAYQVLIGILKKFITRDIKVNIISHRGFWKTKREMNSREAFANAIRNNYGIETDVRDYCGEIVISHDIPSGKDVLTFEEFINNYQKDCSKYNSNITLALNIKSDGLHTKMSKVLKEHNIDNYFLFDMSIPDSMNYIFLNLNVFYRMSEYESISINVKNIQGVWLDQFKSNWYNKNIIDKIQNNWEEVCIVSPELHGRPYLDCWSILKHFKNKKKIMICTDFPDRAEEFFNG